MIHSLSVSLLLALPLLAQQPPEPAKPAATPPAATVRVSFAGGTFGEFVDLLRRQATGANIVMATGAIDALLPRLELNGANIEQALEAACSVAESPWPVRCVEIRGDGAPVYSILYASPPPPPSSSHEAGWRTQVYSLVQLTNDADKGIGIKVETVLSAIEAATEGKLALRFHRDSGLLIVRGVPEHIAVAREVLSELDRDVDRRRSEAKPKASQPEGVGAQNAK
ncbi:MAG: hypothetical protein ACK6D1_19005 [Planctomycetota bacterium]